MGFKLCNNKRKMNHESKRLFLSILVDCMFSLNAFQSEMSTLAAQKTGSDEKNALCKSNTIKNVSLNWFVQLLGMLRECTSTPAGTDFGLEIFATFIYCWSVDNPDLYRQVNFNDINIDHVPNNLSALLVKFLKHPHWKQLKKKLVEWLIVMQSHAKCTQKFQIILKSKIF